MLNNVSTNENTPPEVISRLENLGEQASLIDSKLQSNPGLPDFEFYVEANGNEIWAGLDLKTHYPRILEQHPDKELVINWRSSPVNLV